MDANKEIYSFWGVKKKLTLLTMLFVLLCVRLYSVLFQWLSHLHFSVTNFVVREIQIQHKGSGKTTNNDVAYSLGVVLGDQHAAILPLSCITISYHVLHYVALFKRCALNMHS